MPGQTWEGEWGEPDAPSHEIFLIGPDGLVSVSLRLLDGPEEVTELDGHEIHSAIPLFLGANAGL